MSAPTERYTTGAAFLIAGATLLMTLLVARSGFDFTDEGFYLASIAAPDKYVTSFSFFGHLYHVAYAALSGSIVGLRVFNLLSIYSLAFILSFLVARRYFWSSGRSSAGPAVVAASLATLSLLTVSLQGKWLATPSYNSLALTGTLTVALGAMLCSPVTARPPFVGWILLGVGGWLAFMGKPTTAALLAFVSLTLLLVCRTFQLRGVIWAAFVACALLVCSAYAVSGSVPAFADRIILSLTVLKLQQSGHDIFGAVFRFAALPTGARAVFLYAIAVALSLWAWRAGKQVSLITIGLLFSVSLAAAFAFQRAGIGQAYAKEAFIQLMLLASIVAGALLMVVAQRFKAVAYLSRERIAVGIFFMVLPHVYAFGTNTDYLAQASSAGFFWVLGSLTLMSAFVTVERLRILIPVFSLATAVFALFILVIVAEAPHRQSASLRHATVPVGVGSERAIIRLQQLEAQFVRDVQTSAQGAQMAPGQSVIDLSGKSPGVLYAMGAQGVGAAWLLGGYAGSERATLVVMRHVHCLELASAWVLMGTSRNSIPVSVLNSFGADIAADYVTTGSWTYPVDGDRLTLLKPRRSSDDAANACTRQRSRSNPIL